MGSVQVRAFDIDGTEIVFTVQGNGVTSKELVEEYQAMKSELASAGLGAVSPFLAPKADPKAAPVVSEGGVACQFCGNEVQGTSFGGKQFSAAQIAKSRSEKMTKLGKRLDPDKSVCGRCWTQGGHSKAWDEYYKGNN